MAILEVAIPVPLTQTFDYKSEVEVAKGVRVKVPFGCKKVIGIVLAQKDKSNFEKLRSIEEVLDDTPILDQPMLDFLRWSAQYYHHPIGEVISTALPKNLRIGKDAIIKKITGLPNKIEKPGFSITEEQREAIEKISTSLNKYHGFLLHGVTGSGKTEVYLRLAQTVLNQGKQVLVLVPEIGLTPQMIARFESRLSACIVSIHSQLNETQKLDAYLMAKNGSAGVVLGTRSAIFAPMPNLGLIIIDEEHDTSFKQQSSFRYSARDLCFVRAKQANIPVILGTATPSLEMLKQVMDKKITRLVLAQRAGNAILPKINLIDMRTETGVALSAMLVEKMRQHLSNNKQVMLFINRRGYAPVYFCTECSWKSTCEHCDSSMIYHRHINRLKCHHCNDEKMPEQTCPECGKQSLEVFGYGTQRLEETLGSHFVNTPIIRIDRDTTRRKKAFEQHLKQINSGDPCIIVGTQMLAKGHDFSNLAMVGVLDIDGGLLSSNFRGTEYLAQLLIQVSGRAGRSGEQGEVTIQTRYPDHPIFNYVLSNRYTQFASTLLKQRAQAKMPPFSHQVLICANAKIKQNAENFLQEIANLLKNIKMDSVEIWGPVAPVMEKKADYYYFNLYLQSDDRKSLHQMLATLNQHTHTLTLKNKVRWYLDIDPVE
ncbi:Helicase PriA essential for oriC/DnaA-independent DNA replication [uncultured Gammaproteobacteria bacterium]|uniref:replication restart helicase PriA n=1 Tax=Bathymodiolus heckerae thiotrophic gill symbiont TaxID=1052212 RepID=UPI0010AF3BB3|nr:primosomal protein N' [Bathymodiolus heckerae thiotrophic gill symbiont]CAC9438256.1 Helicase PriA essential for oriC/DnaA-independent DNA replication [uncultured Gammaproteobacteria bacterium]SMN13467.1 Helicase PriA essential for oriC/DnaA-independent DNA replication [Bathymodiolus heckerae thiotrophic gill symbiont]